jgi:hypothetical protein
MSAQAASRLGLRVLVPVLALGILPGLAQVPLQGRYEVLTDTVWKYSWDGDSLIDYPGGGKPNPIVGEDQAEWAFAGFFRLNSLEWISGKPRICIEGKHSWGDYGWEDFKECATGWKGLGLTLAPARPVQPDLWMPRNDLDGLFFPFPFSDTAAFAISARSDTVCLSFWWLTLSHSQNLQRIFSGNADLAGMNRVAKHWFKQVRQTDTLSLGERFTLNRHVYILLPEGTVTLARQNGTSRAPAWRGGRLSRLQGRDLRGRIAGPGNGGP